MKTGLSILILFAIVSIAIFGAFSMAGMEHGQNCWASVAKGVACPESMSPLAAVNFHFDALGKFSLAVFGNTLLLVFLLAISFLIIARVFIPKEIPFFLRSRFDFNFTEAFSKLNRRNFSRWLSILENSRS